MKPECRILLLATVLLVGLLPADTSFAQASSAGQEGAADTAGAAATVRPVDSVNSRAVTPGGDHVGLAIAVLGDVDRDGRSDLVIGAYGDDSSAGDAGAVFVIGGASGDTLFALFGRNDHDNFGASVAALGDIDGDGVPDLAIGAPGVDGTSGQNPDRGCVYLYSGVDGRLIDSVSGEYTEGQLGYTIAHLGDLDGDGIAEIAMGQRRGVDSGLVYHSSVIIYSGRTRQVLRRLEGRQSGDRFGSALAGLGDVDGDGSRDIVIGAYRFSTTLPSAGAIYLYSGSTGTLIRTQTGDRLLGHFGYAVVGAGDLNGDRRDDVYVGARFDDGAGGRAGKVFALSGADGRVLRSFVGTPQAQFGSAVASGGDLDRDGRPDLVVGAPRAEPGGTGAVYVFSGADGTVLATLSGEAVGDNFGVSVAGGEDVDGDDTFDLVVGAVGNDDGGVDAGKVYVYSGRDFSLIQSFIGTSDVSAKDTARVARVIEAERAIRKAGDTLTLPDVIYDSAQVDVMPILRRSVNAEYPPTAIGSGLSGWVKVRILVLADGAPGKVEIADDAGLGPDFRLAALTAARQWFFLPATKDSEPVPAWSVFPIGFAPEEARPSLGRDSAGLSARVPQDSLAPAITDSAAAGAGSKPEPGILPTSTSPPDSIQLESEPGPALDPEGSSSAAIDSSRYEPGTASSTELDSTIVTAQDSSAADDSTTGLVAAAPEQVPPADSGATAIAGEAGGVEVDLSRIYELADLDLAPLLVARVEPQYPASARLAGDTATVVLRLQVDTLGVVGRVDVESCTTPGKGFEEAARSAVRKWRFEAGKRAGQKVNCWVEYALEFRI